MVTIPLLLLLSVLCGATYFFTAAWHPFPGSLAIKGLSVAALAVYANQRQAPLLALGLAASSVGDMLLDVQGRDLFIPGLLAFLMAHIAYTVFFVSRWERPLRVRQREAILTGLVIAYAMFFTTWLAPALGVLAAPVAIYICAITAMVTSAIVARAPWPAIAGVVLFLASDSILAIGKFKGAFPFRDYLVWGTYYLAQFGIATGACGYWAPISTAVVARRSTSR